MHFQKINAGGVRRDDGVSIQIKHHDFLEYRNDNGSTTISMDYDPETREINVYASQVIAWETQNGAENITASAQEKMIADLQDGLKLLKGKFICR